MIYRIADKKDFPILAHLRWQFKHEFTDEQPAVCNYDEFIKVFIQFITNNNTLIHFVADDNGKIVAHVSLHAIAKIPKPSELHGFIGYVTNTYTVPVYRNKGIGSQLLNHLTDWAKNNNLELLIVWPSDKSVSFYERNGFSNKNQILEKKLTEV